MIPIHPLLHISNPKAKQLKDNLKYADIHYRTSLNYGDPKMEKIVHTKEELKEAIKNREQTIVFGRERLAKKITRFRKIRTEEFQATESISVIGSGEASAAASNVLSNAATDVVWAPCIAAYAIMVLGGLMFYALTKNYDVLPKGRGDFKFNESDPKVRGRITLILKNLK